MPRLSATPGVLGAAIAAAVALWWLPGAWLEGAGGFADLPDLSARAASYLVLAQAVLVPLFAARWFGEGHGAVGARIAGDATARNRAPLFAARWSGKGHESSPVGARIAGDATARNRAPLFAARWSGKGHESSAVGARIAGDATGRNVASPAMRAPTVPGRMRAGVVEAVAAVAPAWPLLVLLWLTSELSAHALVASQLTIIVSAVLLARLGGALQRSSLGDWSAAVLRGAAGLVPAAIAWSLRGDLHAWVIS